MPKLHVVYLSLGSNLGDRLANLRAALAALSRMGVRTKRVSSIYETEPVDYLDQPWFLNCVVEAETELEPLALLHAVCEIEAEMGRTREIAKGPRVIDLDILLCDAEMVATSELQIPHPRMVLRRFVLAPLAELNPNLTHPAWHASVAELLERVQDASQVRRLEETL